MKVRILIMLLCLTQFLFVGAQNVDFNEQKDLELKEVIELPNLTKQQIFVAVQSLLSDCILIQIVSLLLIMRIWRQEQL